MAEGEREMESLGRDFEGLARASNAILESAGAIVGCAESDRMASVLPGVQKLGSAAKGFIRTRLEATAGILDTVIAEQALLQQLSHLTRGQKAIVRETEMLRVLTNIEVARLGEVGAGFEYLAHELDDFSQSVTRSTQELTSHTEERREAIGETRRALGRELPGMREEFARIEQSLDNAMRLVEATLGQMYEMPVQFRGCVEGVAGQIAGVVAAIQAHDITRQQIEHVTGTLATIAAGIEDGENVPAMQAGLTIQSYQLESLRGSIDVSSQPGAGTTVTLRLPLTLAIIDGLLVRVGDAFFVLPLASTLECIELTREEVERASGKHVANVRGAIVPYIRLRQYFSVDTPRPEREQIMVVESEEGRCGLVVDEVLGECQTVIRNLGRLYRHVQVVSGATILGNGAVALILDPQRLVQEAIRTRMQRERGRAQSPGREHETGRPRDGTLITKNTEIGAGVLASART
jgi:chemotaxis signal transduction protein